MNDDIRQRVRALGNVFGPSELQATRGIYEPSVRRQRRAGIAVRQDVPYGTHPRQVMDVYGTDLDGPAVMFIHGGGFNAGDKRGTDWFYSNIGYHFAGSGVQAILANYRLVPHAQWPSGIDDVATAIDRCREQLGVGTARRPLVLIGQSAGATHVAGYLFSQQTAVHADSSLAGCVLMSGVYRITASATPGALAYFGAGPDPARSPLSQVRPLPMPVLVSVSEFDPPAIAGDGYELAQALTAANGRAQPFAWLEGHNHVSPVHSLGSAQDDVAQLLVRFVTRCAADRAA